MFMLFAGKTYDAPGGWDYYIGSYPSMGAAMKDVESQGNRWDWAQIVCDREKRLMIEGTFEKEGRSWDWDAPKEQDNEKFAGNGWQPIETVPLDVLVLTWTECDLCRQKVEHAHNCVKNQFGYGLGLQHFFQPPQECPGYPGQNLAWWKPIGLDPKGEFIKRKTFNA